MPGQFCGQAELERSLGGAKVLKQLLDPANTGNVDQQSIVDILDEGSGEIASYIQLAVDIGSLSPPYPRILVLKAADVCAYHAYLRGTHGIAAPEKTVQRYEAAVQWAKDVGQRLATLGVSPKPTLDPPAEMIDPNAGPIPAGFSDPADDFEMSYSPRGGQISVGGFRRGGFR